MSQRFVVVGAGIAGLATAAALQRCGHDVAVIEERTDTAPGAGISIWPNALAALDEIGLGDAVRDAGGRIAAGAMRWYDGTWLRRPSPERLVQALGEPLVVVRRAALRDILVGALTPETVRYGTAATGLIATAEGVRVMLADGSDLYYTAVIGADGTHSVVARHLNGALSNRYVGYTAWRGIAEYSLATGLAGETLGPGAEVGHVPLGDNLTYWFATERVPAGRRSPKGELEYLKTKFAGWADPVPAILDATAPDGVLRNDLYDRSPARHWARGPVVLVGDAAHPMRPHLGQGGCQGLEDAAILAALLTRSTDVAAAFAEFATVRKARTAPLVRESATIGTLVNLRPAALSAIAIRASMLVPEALLTHHLATLAARSAFQLPR